MGLASSPGWFQAVMLRVFEGLERVGLYVEVVCFSKNGQEHVSDLRIFERLITFGLKLAPKKPHPGMKVVIVSGHRVTAGGIAPHLENEEALTKKPMSTNVSLLRSLMGEVGYYRNIPPKMAAATKYTELTGCKKLSSHRNIRRTTVKPPGVGFSRFCRSNFWRPVVSVSRRVRRWVGCGDRTGTDRWYHSPD